MTSVAIQGQEHIPASPGLPETAVTKGKLIPLRTRAEVQASTDTTSVYIVELPNRSANALLGVLRDVVPVELTNSLQHLRRFVKPEFLPQHLRCVGHATRSDSKALETAEVLKDLPSSSSRDAKSTTSHLLICPTSTISLSALELLFLDRQDLFKPLAPVVREVIVPVFAPTSAKQASSWSEIYWPTIYRNTNPYGPHPSLVKRTELELLANGDADRYMDLAHRVASGAPGQCGISVGVVIVERGSDTKTTRVVSVAQDARFAQLNPHDQVTPMPINQQNCTGNVMGHAVLRAIAMVAQKRRVLAQLVQPTDILDEKELQNLLSTESNQDSGPFASQVLSESEAKYLINPDNLSPNGYLCLNLEIYLSHEPCVMCAMAILHSRFSRIVFAKRMLKTGALLAEDNSLGHGLFWRDQLNWKFLVWQWVAFNDEGREALCDDDVHI